MTNEKKDSAVQESNAELRVRYLEFLQFLNKKPVNIRLCDKIDVSGDFSAMQKSGDHFIINALKTPTAVIENGVIRSRDTVSMSVSTTESSA